MADAASAAGHNRGVSRRPAPPRSRPTASTARRPATRPAARPPARAAAPERGGEPPAPVTPRRIGGATVRLLVLGVVVLVAFAVLFPTVRAYLAQRSELDRLATQVAEAERAERDLQAELDRWQDPAYVAAQARERLQFVLPGETSYRVIDPEVIVEAPEIEITTDGSGTGPAVPLGAGQRPWYATVWQSVEEAGAAGIPDPDAAPDTPAAPTDGPVPDPATDGADG